MCGESNSYYDNLDFIWPAFNFNIQIVTGRGIYEIQ